MNRIWQMIVCVCVCVCVCVNHSCMNGCLLQPYSLGTVNVRVIYESNILHFGRTV
jgi:hypothetical protein